MSTIHNRSKHGPQQSGMTHAQWRAAQRVRSGTRWFFGAWSGKPGVNCTKQNQTTYVVGRNKAKREARASRRANRV